VAFPALVRLQEASPTAKLLEAAQNGDHVAQYELARAYLEGRGVKVDGAEGAKWLKLAAEGGIPDAQNDLGVLLELPPAAFTDARKWFESAAKQAHPGAQYNLGRLYENGRGVQRDQAVAADWYRKAAEQGYAKAQHNIGAMYMEGRGVLRNDATAAAWFAKAAEQGLGPSQYNLGGFYLLGRGVPQDLSRSFLWLTLAGRNGEGRAEAALRSLRAKMTSAQILRGESLVSEWLMHHALGK
jgi:TPR repeat protein